MNNRYWLTPKDIYDPLNQEFHFDFDPCPYPKPLGYSAIDIDWGGSNFVNPPFRKKDGDGLGPTAFVHKAIEQQKLGRSSVLLLPVQSYVNLLLEAGAVPRSLGRVKWLEVETRQPYKSPSPTCCFVLPGHNRAFHRDAKKVWLCSGCKKYNVINQNICGNCGKRR